MINLLGGAISSVANAVGGKDRWQAIAAARRSRIINWATAGFLILFIAAVAMYFAAAFLNWTKIQNALPILAKPDPELLADALMWMWAICSVLLTGKVIDVGLGRKERKAINERLAEKLAVEEAEERAKRFEKHKEFDTREAEGNAQGHEPDIEIIRDYREKITRGIVFIGGERVCSVFEPPRLWKGERNVPGRCCILEGKYDFQFLPASASGKFEKTGCVLIHPVLGRSQILIHPANYVRQLRGCLAPFMTASAGGHWRSQEAMKKIIEALGKKRDGTIWIHS